MAKATSLQAAKCTAPQDVSCALLRAKNVWALLRARDCDQTFESSNS